MCVGMQLSVQEARVQGLRSARNMSAGMILAVFAASAVCTVAQAVGNLSSTFEPTYAHLGFSPTVVGVVTGIGGTVVLFFICRIGLSVRAYLNHREGKVAERSFKSRLSSIVSIVSNPEPPDKNTMSRRSQEVCTVITPLDSVVTSI